MRGPPLMAGQDPESLAHWDSQWWRYYDIGLVDPGLCSFPGLFSLNLWGPGSIPRFDPRRLVSLGFGLVFDFGFLFFVFISFP